MSKMATMVRVRYPKLRSTGRRNATNPVKLDVVAGPMYDEGHCHGTRKTEAGPKDVVNHSAWG